MTVFDSSLERPPALYATLQELVANAQTCLGRNFVAAYLHGSFAAGDWDADSDVDFLIVTEQEISEAERTALQAMHARLYRFDSTWAQRLDGSYIPQKILARPDPTRTPLLYLDNGSDVLVPSDHDNTVVVRWLVREYGITLAGRSPKELIEEIAPDALKREVRETMREWGAHLLAHPNKMDNGWYQPFVVLSYCRMLQTLEIGRVESKPEGARWALANLDAAWHELVRRAQEEQAGRLAKVSQKARREDLVAAADFIRYALQRTRLE